MSDYNIDKAKNDIQNLQDQNSYDFQEIKRLDRLLKDYDKRVLQAINMNNQINEKIQYDYENIKKIIIDENVSTTLDKKIDDKYNSNKNKIDEMQLSNTNKFLEITDKITNVNSQLDNTVRELENSKASKVELDIERKRIDNFTSLPEGSTTGDAELIDGRVGADGVTYENIGTSIREQFKNVNKTTDTLLKSCTFITEEVEISILENWIEANGSTSSYNNFKHVEISNIKTNETFLLKCQVGSNIRAYVIKNSGGYVTRVYKQENYGTKHDYDLKVTINSDEEGGTLCINTFTDTYIGVQTVAGITFDSLQLANKNIFMQSNLYGKKIIFFGDSITANKGSWGDEETIRAKYNMTGANYAVGGMTYTVRSDSNDTNNIYLRIQSKLSDTLDADYICFQGATNDAFRGAPLGEMLAEDDFTTELSTSTFAGAFEMACRLLRTQVPGAKLLYLANIKIPRNKNLINYVNLAKKICNKYSIKYLDLWNDSGMCAALQSFNDKYYSIDSSVSTVHGDQTHPTSEAYKVHLNDKVDFALNSL